MVKTTIVLPEHLHEQIRQLAFKNRISMGEWCRATLELAIAANLHDTTPCEINLVDTTGASKCKQEATETWQTPEGFMPAGKFQLCKKHYREVAVA